MNKGELVSAVRNNNEKMTWKDADAAVNSVLDVISVALKSEDVVIAGFGKFTSKIRPARTVRNPRTGGAVDVPDKRVVSFKAGKSLKDTVNS